MNIEYATVEDTADGTWLHLSNTDGEMVSFELTVEAAKEVVDVLGDWLTEEADR